MLSFQGTRKQCATLCRQSAHYTLLVAGMVIIAGCGGGGGASVAADSATSDNSNAATTVTPAPNVVVSTDTTQLNPLYMGKRELATITEAAALDFISLGEITDVGLDLTMPMETLDIGLIDTTIAAMFRDDASGSGSADCYKAGSASVKMTDKNPDAGGSVTVAETSFGYNGCISDTGSNADGRYTKLLSVDNTPPIKRRETATYERLTIADKNVTGVFDGTSSVEVAGVKLSTESNLYTKRKNIEVLKLGFQQVGAGSLDGNAGGVSLSQGSITEMHGRVYLGSYGYVEPKVVQAMSFDTQNVFSGELILTGANNTKAQMFPSSTSTFVLNTDENGDGGYEKTRIVRWSEAELSFLW